MSLLIIEGGKMDKTRVKASFIMEGEELNPEYVTQVLDLTPTKSWHKDEVYKENKKRACGSWILSIDFEESYDIMNQMDKLCSYIEGREVKIKFIKDKYCGIIVVSIVVEVENQEVPGIIIKDKMSRLMANIEADIDIDIYLMS